MPFEVDMRVPVPIRVSVDVTRPPRTEARVAPPDTGGLLILAMAIGVLGTALAVCLVAALTAPSEGAERAGFLATAVVSAAGVRVVAMSARELGAGAARAGLGVLLGVAAGLAAGRLVGAPALGVSLLILIGVAASHAALGRLPARATGPAVALVVLAGVIAFTPPEAPLRLVRVVPGLLAAAGVAWILQRGLPARAARWADGSRVPLRPALDGVFLVLFLLVITDCLFVPDESISEHMGFYLGPVNDVLNGRAMLVDTWSQYGNGVMYALAPWFLVAPLGFGTFSILTTVATAAQYALVYVILRMTVRSQLLAIGTVGIAAVVILFAGLGDYANYPSIGVLRFGPPYLVVLLGLLAVRSARGRTLFVATAAVVVAIAVPWSAETGATTVAVAGAMLAVDALAVPAPTRERLRSLAVRLGALAGLALAALLLFCVATLIAAGAWPDWGPYLEFLRLYTTHGFGTLPIVPWSPGLVVGAIYAASAVMVAALVLLRPEFVRLRRAPVLACAGLTALGIVSYTYFLGRSHPNNVMHVCLPAFMLVALWLDGRGISVLAGRERAVRWTAAVLTAVAVIAFADSVPSLRAKWSRTVFAAVVPKGGAGPTQQSLVLRLRDMWSNPAVDPLAPAAEPFVRRNAGGRPSVLVLRSSLFVETLARLRRSDALPISIPSQDNLSPAAFPRVHAAVDAIPAGARLFARTDGDGRVVQPELVGLQRSELRWIGQRFTMQQVARDAATGLTAFALTPRA